MKKTVSILFFALLVCLNNIASHEVYHLKNSDKISFFLRAVKTGSLKITTYLCMLQHNTKIVTNGNACQDLIVEFSPVKGSHTAFSEVKLDYENNEKRKIEKFYTLVFE